MVASESPTDETNVQVDSKQNAGSNEGWCVWSRCIQLCRVCVGPSCLTNSLLDVCRCVVMVCIRLSCLTYGSLLLHVLALCGVYVGQSCLICSVLGVLLWTVVFDLFGAGCTSLWCRGDEHSCCVGKIPVVVVTMRRNNVVL